MRTRWLLLIAFLTGIVAFSGCLGGDGGGSTGPSGYETELEGTWNFTFSDTNFTYSMTWVFSDSNWTRTDNFTTDQTTVWSGTFSLNTSASPKEIDLYCLQSQDTSEIGETSLGIYALNSTATVCTLAVADFGDTVRPPEIRYGFVLDKQ